MILSDRTCYRHISKINLTYVQSSDDVTLLDVMTDKNLTFKKHIDNLVRKAQYKLHALRRIRNFLTIEKLNYWVMLLQAVNSIMHLQYGCSVGKHCILKLKKIIIGR